MATKKITALTVAASVLSTDIVVIVADPAGTPATKRATISLIRGSLSTDAAGTLPLANGGTGASSLASGVIHSNGSVLSSSAVVLTSEVSGTLPIGNGGTGAASLATGVIHSNGSVLSSSLLVNADVSASAAIAGSKIDPMFGAQTISTSTKATADFVEVGGGTMPTTGGIRYDSSQHGGEILTLRSSGGTTRPIITLNGTDTPQFGNGSLNVAWQMATGTFTANAVASFQMTGTLNINYLPIVGVSGSGGMFSSHGRATQAMADGNQTPANTIFSRSLIRTTGALTANRTIFFSVASSEDRSYWKAIQNDCTGIFNLIVDITGTPGTTVSIASGKTQLCWFTPGGVVAMGSPTI